MADREKVISGWERCRKHTCPSIDSKEYADCEYTVGLYCRQDLLIDDTIALLKEQDAEIKRLKGELHGFGDLFHTLSEKTEKVIDEQQKIVRCKDCKKRNSWECWQYFFGRIKIQDDWFCADGEKRDKNA